MAGTPDQFAKSESKRASRRAIALEFLCLFLLMIGVSYAVYIDMVFFGVIIDEASITQTFQHGFLIVCCILFFLGARRHPDKRGYLLIPAFLFLIMEIREHDALLDMIEHGFWKYPAAVAFAVGVFMIRPHRATIREPFLDHFETRGFGYAAIGFFILVVYSRLFGSSIILEDALGDLYAKPIKTMVQEGVELLGYAIILMGCAVSYRQGFSTR